MFSLVLNGITIQHTVGVGESRDAVVKALAADINGSLLFNLADFSAAGDGGTLWIVKRSGGSFTPTVSLFKGSALVARDFAVDAAVPVTLASMLSGTPVQGEVPNPLNPPSGCSFRPRCPHANARCKAERPALKMFGGALIACHGVEEGRI